MPFVFNSLMKFFPKVVAVLFIALLSCVSAANTSKDSQTGITVSGLSSGAFMATQLFIAYSSLIDGHASFAGGPYYASQGNVLTASALMSNPTLVDVEKLISQTKIAALTLSIDDTSHLAGKKSYIFTGTKDSVVHPGVVRRLVTYLKAFGGDSLLDDDIPAEHAMPTLSYGHPCEFVGLPYINDCGFDGAGEALKSIISNRNIHTLNQHHVRNQEQNDVENAKQFNLSSDFVLKKGIASPGSLFALDQASFAPLLTRAIVESYGLQRVAYAYVPVKCRAALRSSILRNTIISSQMTHVSDLQLDALSQPTVRGHFGRNVGDLDRDQLENLAVRNAWRIKSSSTWLEDGIEEVNSTSDPQSQSCPVHISLHGCKQTLDDIGSAFLENAGFNDWAEGSGIIVLYPQAKSIMLTNPNGCWDWWGFSGMNFATKSSVQMSTIMNMATALRTGKSLLSDENTHQ